MAEVQEFESEVGELETVTAQLEQEQQQAVQEPEPDVPEKYRGKSVVDIVKMHQDTERSLSRQGQELGEIRKLADELIKSQLKPKEQPEPPKEVDYFENPDEAVNRKIESHPDVQAAKAYAESAQKELSKQKLHQMHPDMDQVVADPGFLGWVSQSSVRKQLLVQADQGYDIAAAHELLSTYKELKAVKQVQAQRQTSTVDKTSRNQALQAASVDTGGSGETTRKIYKRSDLIRLQMNDPARYEAMNDEILAAYSEGRVR